MIFIRKNNDPFSLLREVTKPDTLAFTGYSWGPDMVLFWTVIFPKRGPAHRN